MMVLYHNILYKLPINNESKKTKNVEDMTEDNKSCYNSIIDNYF